MQIQPQLFTLDQMLSKRLFRIPEYQRAYSWGSKQRGDLFEDIRASFDAGTGKIHFMATVVGLRRDKLLIVTDEHQVIEVVDGQQRITTLILLLKAVEKALDVSNDHEAKVREDLRETLVKPDEVSLLLLQTNHDTSHHYSNYIRMGICPDVSSADTLADRELLGAIRECEAFVADWSGGGRSLLQLVGHLKNRLTFIFHEIGDESLVYSVFEVLNSRGLDVSWFDRLKSMLMAVVFESNSGNREELIHQVHTIWGDIYRAVGLRLGLSTESLRFAATLRTKNRPSQALGEERSVETLLSQCESPAQVIEASSWLLTVTKCVDELLADRRMNAVTQIAHARLVAAAVRLRDDFTKGEKSDILSTWEKVTFRIFGIHQRDARSAVGQYVRLAWDIQNNKPSAREVMVELSKIGQDYPCNERTLRDELGREDAYGPFAVFSLEELRYFFQRYEEHLSKEAGQNFKSKHWNKIWEASVVDSIEHILPQSRDTQYVHWLGNLMLLPPKLNSKLQDKPPRAKAAAYRKTGLLAAQEVADIIDGNNGRWAQRDAIARERGLLKWAASEWGD